MKTIVVIFILLSILSCEPPKANKSCDYNTFIYIGTTGTMDHETYYTKDLVTGLCFASHGAHGFTCVPCDSLKKVKHND